jgi:competence protein ComEA
VSPHDEGLEPLAAPARPLPPLTWRDRVADLLALAGGRPLASAAVVGGLVVAAVLLLPLAQRLAAEPRTQPVEAVLPMAGTSTTLAGSPPATSATSATGSASAVGGAAEGAALVVHAAGAVVDPGVYELPDGSRVDDLVVAAGGLAPDADGDRVNLALPLVDGERVYVPSVGEQELPEAPGPATSGGDAAGASGGGAGGGGPVDLNTADLAELDELPGVGPVTAQAIVDHREQQGPFTAVDQLLDVQGIGEARLAQLRDLVVV